MDELITFLNQSFDPTHAREAEKQLRSVEMRPEFPLILLRITSSAELPLATRQAAALLFKNLIRRKWTDADGNHLLHANDVATIKSESIPLMISLPHSLQAQIGEAISIMADSDFPDRWENLVPSLVQRLGTNPETNTNVLVVAHTIFRRWRPLFRSDALFTEILLVLKQFAEPYLQVLKVTHEKIQNGSGGAMDPKELLQWLQSMNQLVKIFFDLNCQDLPAFFEDHMDEFMSILHDELVYTNQQILALTDDDESGVLEEIKEGIFKVIQLYVQRYAGEFAAHLPRFLSTSELLLVSIGPEPRYDIVVTRALAFLTSVAQNQAALVLEASEVKLDGLVEKIIIPNMMMRESDVEQFEDEPVEYVRRDLEGSDADTRRRAASDFLREIGSPEHGSAVTDYVMQHVNAYIKEYELNPQKNWRYKDAAAYLFNAIAARGQVTSSGVHTMNLLIDVMDFFDKNIAPDLTHDNVNPILQVDAVRFLYNYRIQLTKDQLVQTLPPLARLLSSSNSAVSTYAAITIERILSIRSKGELMFTKQDIESETEPLINSLMTLILRHRRDVTQLSENEFLMKCIMRVLITVKTTTMAATLVPQFVNLVQAISANPANPRFNHYLFENIGVLIRYNGGQIGEGKLEETVVQPLLEILGNDVTEFVPYVLQLFAEVLKIQSQRSLPNSFKQIIRPLLTPEIWEPKGNVPALVGLLLEILSHGSAAVVETGNLLPLLGVFQKLIASRANDVYGLELLQYILIYIPHKDLAPVAKDIANLLLVRLQSSRTDKFVMKFTYLMYFISSGSSDIGLGPDFAVQFLDNVQAGIFARVFEAFMLPNTLKLSGSERRVAVIGLTKLLCESESLVTGQYSHLWAPGLDVAANLVSTNVAEKSDNDFIAEHDLEELSFGSTFSKLSTTASKPLDPAPGVAQPDQFFLQHVQEVLRQHNQALAPRLGQLSADAVKYLSDHGIN